MKKILIDAFQKEEVRIATVQDNRLENLEILKVTGSEKRGNIYKGTVSRIEKHLEAAFIDYGMDRHGFLPLKNIAEEFKQEFKNKLKNQEQNSQESSENSSDETEDEKPKVKKQTSKEASITDCLEVGQEIIVQVEKEERGNKGAALTTIINLASTYIVLTPNDSKVSGISKSIPYSSRTDLKNTLDDIIVPKNMGLIVRTIGAKKSSKDLQWCLDYLCSLWSAIQKYASEKKAPFLIYQESLVIKSMRDSIREDVEKVIVNDEDIYKEVKQYADGVIPDYSEKISLYDSQKPIFSEYDIEKQVDLAFVREITLPSGGSIIIDTTEALVAVDVNSSKSTKGSNIEETALNTNTEAAIEIARQIRLRDIGGLIVIDFIDMKAEENRNKVIKTFSDSCKTDRALIKIGGISNFGLLEISRQRLRSSINDLNRMSCPQCKGSGSVQTTESMAVQMIRHLQSLFNSAQYQKIILYVPVAVSIYLLNEKRFEIAEIESKHKTNIVIVPNPNYQIPNFNVDKFNEESKKEDKLSFEAIQQTNYNYDKSKKTREIASMLSPIDPPARKKSLFERLGFVKPKPIAESSGPKRQKSEAKTGRKKTYAKNKTGAQRRKKTTISNKD